MRIFLFVFATILFCSCEKPLKTPEVSDPIYNDLIAQEAKVDQDIAAVDAQIAEKKIDVEKAEPQSGKISYNKKKVWALMENKRKLQKVKLGLQISQMVRQKEVRVVYADAFLNKKPWPIQEDADAYFLKKKSRSHAKEWSGKGRREEYMQSRGTTNMSKSKAKQSPQH